MASRARPPLARRASINPQPTRLWDEVELRWERPRRYRRPRPLSLLPEPHGPARAASAPAQAPETALERVDVPRARAAPGPVAPSAPAPAVAPEQLPLRSFASARQIYRARRRAAARARRRRALLASMVTLAAVAGALAARATTNGHLSASAAEIGMSSRLLDPSRAHRRARERALLHRIARCESSFNPRSLYDAGRYRGFYQFDMETWRSVGGRGDPAAAMPAEQRHRALLLLRRRGLAPWPVCGPRAARGA